MNPHNEGHADSAFANWRLRCLLTLRGRVRSCAGCRTEGGQLWQSLSMLSSGLDGIGFQEHDGPGTAAMIDRLIWIWAQECPDGNFGVRWKLALRHTDCEEFRCFAASSDDAVIGYAYGMRNGEGTGFGEPGNVISLGSHDLLTEQIAREKAGGVIRTDPEWLAAYDIAEVQVLDDYRGRGIGEALVQKLCRSLPGGDRVVLTVEPQNARARRVYERVGFVDLHGVPVISLRLPDPQVLMGASHCLPGLDSRARDPDVLDSGPEHGRGTRRTPHPLWPRLALRGDRATGRSAGIP